MPRLYQSRKRYKKYDEKVIKRAVEEYRKSKNSLQAIATKYNINKSVLFRHSTRTMKKQGGQTILSEDEEIEIIKYINICAEWGHPLNSLYFRFLVKCYLDEQGRIVQKFKNNLPGPDFIASFVKRHKDTIAQSIYHKNRLAVSPDPIQAYFRKLQLAIENVDPSNIINFAETNLTDDTSECCLLLRKQKTNYPDGVINNSMASVSIMIAASATAVMLPSYVVYRAEKLCNTWTISGPPGTRYNHSQSGCFDAYLFEDWIKTIMLPYFRDKKGKKCLIGGNLSLHLSLDVIKICHEENISFVFLPKNSTNIIQPLDAAFFCSMDIAWRNILLKWKNTDGKSHTTVPHRYFPNLLKNLMEDLNVNAKDIISTGFRKASIWPNDKKQFLSTLLKENNIEKVEDDVNESKFNSLKNKTTVNTNKSKRQRNVHVIPKMNLNRDIKQCVEIEEEILQNVKNTKTILKNNALRNNYVEKGKKQLKKIKEKVVDVENNILSGIFNFNVNPDIETTSIAVEEKKTSEEVGTNLFKYEKDEYYEQDEMQISQNIYILIDHTIDDEALLQCTEEHIKRNITATVVQDNSVFDHDYEHKETNININ